MTQRYPNPDYGPEGADQLPVTEILSPAIRAGVLVAAAQFVIDVVAALGRGSLLDSLFGAAAGAVGTIGLVAALAYLALLGASDDVLLTGGVVVYAATFVSRLIQAVYFGWDVVGLDQLLHPLRPVALFVGVGLALRWVLAEHPLVE